MAFEWNRIYKWEENHERDITESVEQYIFEYYGVGDIEELSKEQIEEVDTWRSENLHEYNIMQVGFSNLVNHWESCQEE